MSHVGDAGRKARRVLHFFRAREWLIILGAILAAVLVGVLAFTVVDASHVRADAIAQAQAQSEQAQDARAAQSRRIDALTEQLQETRDELAEQARISGRQEQAIADLADQVESLGGDPVADHVAPDKPHHTATTKPTTKPTSEPTSKPSKPAPTPEPDDGLICSLLPLC